MEDLQNKVGTNKEIEKLPDNEGSQQESINITQMDQALSELLVEIEDIELLREEEV